MSAKTNICVLGAGSWGTALAILLASNHHAVTLWSRREDHCQNLILKRENEDYLPGIKLPKDLTITSDIEKAVSGKKILIFVVPSHGVRAMSEKIKPYINESMLILNAAKGLEADTLKTMRQVIAEVLFQGEDKQLATLSGPNHAEEVGKSIPSATVVASKNRKIAEELQRILINARFRVYTNPDVIGVEMGGALKNVMALGSGISDGLGFGDNTKAAFMTRGLYEISRLGIAMGARPMTFSGLSGIGDLIVTCTSEHSRNRRAGKLIGQGKTIDDITSETKMVIEGVKTTQAAKQLAEKYNTEMPITEEIYQVLFKKKPPLEGVENLMERVRTNEMEEVVDEKMWEDA